MLHAFLLRVRLFEQFGDRIRHLVFPFYPVSGPASQIHIGWFIYGSYLIRPLWEFSSGFFVLSDLQYMPLKHISNIFSALRYGH